MYIRNALFKLPVGFLVALLLLTLAAVFSACTTATVTPSPTFPPPAATPIPPTLPLTSTHTVPPPTSTATPIPSATATEPWVPTPFTNSLDAFHLIYDPEASLEIPPRGSISMLFWGSEIPVTPVASLPELLPFPTPQGMEHSADRLIEFGCELDYWGWAWGTCPPDNPLQRFGCDVLVDPRGIASGLDPQMPLVAICKIFTEEHEAARINGLYLSGCAFRTENHYIFEIDGQYGLVSSEDELRLLFAPIDSPEEAASYAQLITGLDAIYSFSYDPTLMYFQETIAATHVTEIGGTYELNLFNNATCGCEPWFNTQIILRVDHSGQVTWVEAVPIYMTTGWGCAD